AVRRLLFILSCPADPRDLHSFPTRRSSDLAGQRARLGGRLLALRNQPARNRTGVESPAVVFDDDAEAALVEGCNDLHRALLGLADRKSTRLNSSHVKISYAVFCLKKKKNDL